MGRRLHKPFWDEDVFDMFHTDKWIVDGLVNRGQLFSTKEHAIDPFVKCTTKGPGASG